CSYHDSVAKALPTLDADDRAFEPRHRAHHGDPALLDCLDQSHVEDGDDAIFDQPAVHSAGRAAEPVRAQVANREALRRCGHPVDDADWKRTHQYPQQLAGEAAYVPTQDV